MTFEPAHFQNNMLPHDILKCITILEELDGSLKEILLAETAAGNRIFDVLTGWPEPESILVLIRHAFKKKHKKAGIKYQQLNDPHYWNEEYSSTDPVHLLVCPF